MTISSEFTLNLKRQIRRKKNWTPLFIKTAILLNKEKLSYSLFGSSNQLLTHFDSLLVVELGIFSLHVSRVSYITIADRQIPNSSSAKLKLEPP